MKVAEVTKPLFLFKQGEKFIKDNQIYTVYQQENSMIEVFTDGRFWAWPIYNGKEMTKVQQVFL